MDQYGFDKFSLVNFAVGVIWQQAGLSFLSLVILYSIFKLVGNTSLGLYVINTYLQPVLGFKMVGESYKNLAMDIGLCFSGWFVGHLVLGATFHTITVALIGLTFYFWIPAVLTKYMVYLLPTLAVSGILFQPLWFLMMGLGVAYGFDHYTLVRLP